MSRIGSSKAGGRVRRQFTEEFMAGAVRRRLSCRSDRPVGYAFTTQDRSGIRSLKQAPSNRRSRRSGAEVGRKYCARSEPSTDSPLAAERQALGRLAIQSKIESDYDANEMHQVGSGSRSCQCPSSFIRQLRSQTQLSFLKPQDCFSVFSMGFAPGDSPACASPMHQRTMGILGYGEIREIRVTQRPELLIFRAGTDPPALRVTDWVGAANFSRVVADLRNAYQARKSQHTEIK
jgi:hypothetical protein